MGATSLASCGGAIGPGPDVASAPRETFYEARFVSSDELLVEVIDATGQFARVVIEEDAEHFITELAAGSATGELAPVALSPSTTWPLHVSACDGANVCRIRYRIDVGGLARAFRNPQFGFAFGEDLLMPATSFLIRPAADAPVGTFRLALVGEDPRRYWSGLVSDADGVFSARLDDLPQAPYGVFSREIPHNVTTERVAPRASNARANVLVLGGPAARPDDEVFAWVEQGLGDALGYLGAYAPTPLVMVLIGPGDGVDSGFTLGNGGASVLVGLGEDTSADVLARDWVMTHELLHASMPSLATRHNWLEEGFATYVEPLARSGRSRLSEEQVWNDWYSAMWQGQPTGGEGGLDGTHTWGRLYWGGAGFWLAAEIAVFEQTNGQRSLADCFGKIARESRGVADRWSIERFLTACDEGLGAAVVRPLYEQMAGEPVTLPFDEMFAKLGVEKRRGGVSFREDAPLSICRRNMTRAR